MGDLLIRNLDDALKREIQDSAKQNGRSLSDEAVVLLRRSLSIAKEYKQSAGERLRAILEASDAYLTEEEIAAIEAGRHEPDREPPRFGE